MTATTALPNVAELVGPILQRVEPERRPLLLAIAERMAAARYRRWADGAGDAATRASFLACAAREEEIAARVEALHPDADRIEREMLASQPDLAEIDRTVFADRPLAHQLTIQAQGERVGAATWRSFAQRDPDPARRSTYLACATLEEANAEALESMLRAS